QPDEHDDNVDHATARQEHGQPGGAVPAATALGRHRTHQDEDEHERGDRHDDGDDEIGDETGTQPVIAPEPGRRAQHHEEAQRPGEHDAQPEQRHHEDFRPAAGGAELRERVVAAATHPHAGPGGDSQKDLGDVQQDGGAEHDERADGPAAATRLGRDGAAQDQDYEL